MLALTKTKVKELNLKMRVLQVDIEFSGSKIVVYFSAEARIDFRQLVKEIAAHLKTRIELKQVGSRDETKLLGGVGICGREYCCSSFLREFIPVSIRMAKNQNLALNPTKVSGGCGRLLCCLTYENDAYTDLRQSLPSLNSMVTWQETGDKVKVLKSDLLSQMVLVEDRSGDQHTVKVQNLEFVSRAARSKGKKPSKKGEKSSRGQKKRGDSSSQESS